MGPPRSFPRLRTFFLLTTLLTLFIVKPGKATHGQGADLTYTCLGNGEYVIRASFYRDCAGISAPSTITVDASSDSCNDSLSITLDQVAGTGQDITPICSAEETECNGGNHPGVEEYVYTDTVTLPQQCPDWEFDFSICCRNQAITTIDAPNNENLHLKAELNNADYPCNSSPAFSNPPVPYICVGDTFCFNHGATDPDGDSLSYSLVTPTTSPNGSTVTYLNGYSASQPLQSNPPVSIDPVTGDICMAPTQQDVTVMQVQVKEWRNGEVIGTVNRDVQVQVLSCSNQLPYLSGINGNGDYQMTVCAGEQVQFQVPSFDEDSTQDLSLSWNQGIPSAQFDTGTGSRPTGIFSWTPSSSHIGNGPHCFTVKVEDDNCPLNGSQVYSFCLTVNGIDSLALSSNPANCGASNGNAHVDSIYGSSGSFSYYWSPVTGNNQGPDYMGIPADTYTVEVTDTAGCTIVDSVVVGPGSLPGNLSSSTTQVSCYGGSDGTATVQVAGGQGPYQYTWSNGDTTQTADSLSAGTYTVEVVTADGCYSTDTVSIQEPSPLVLSLDSLSGPLCHGDSNGYGEVSAQGGTPPYDFQWSTNPVLTGQQVYQLYAGTYTVTVTDGNGCSDSLTVQVQEPAPLSTSMSVQDPTCSGANDGEATVSVSGGTGPYQYNWQGMGVQQPTLSSIGAGQYVVEVTDQNGCTIHDTAQLVDPAPIVIDSVDLQDPLCYGQESGAISVSVSGGNSPYNYNWVGVNQSGPQISSIEAGTYVLEVMDTNNCTKLDTFTLQDPTPLQAQVDSVFDVSCYGDSNGAAIASASGGTAPYSFEWNIDSPQTGTSAFGLSGGTHSVTVIDSNGCQSTTNFQVDEPAPMDVTLSPVSDTICPNDSITLSASASGGNGQYIYVWGQGLGTGATHTVSPVQSKDYTVVAYDTAGCSSSEDTLHVEVRDLEVNLLEVNGNGPICEGEMATISASYQDEGSNVDFSWDQGVGSGPGPHYVLPADSTTYTVTVTDQCQNTLTDSLLVGVYPKPPIKVVAPDAEGCGKVSVKFENDTPRASSTDIRWYFSTGDTLSVPEPELDFTNTGYHSAKLKLTSQEGCTNIQEKPFSVEVHPVPSAEFEVRPGKRVSILDPEFRFHYSDPYAVDWTFSFGDGDSSDQREPVHVYDEVGTYPVSLKARTLHGCTARTVREVVVEDRFAYYVPNAFSPDGDGINDSFDGEGAAYVKRELMIFNRWGELIFESHDRSRDWNGEVNGKKVKQDVYVYKIRVKDHKGNWHEKKGHVTVLR
ncbi:MAG: gliding motility-associated C-terminal domain-containing protein [Flavobacteriales bacterium]